MSMRGSNVFNPVQMVEGALSLSPVLFGIALLVVGFTVTIASGSTRWAAHDSVVETRSVRKRYARERRTLGIAALVVVALFFAEFLFRGYFFAGPDLVSWWQFATPIVVAALGIGAILVQIMTRGTTRPEAPVMLPARRSWTSFSSRSALIGGGLVILALVATTLAAGFASTPNGEGQYVWLTIPVPNEAAIDPIRVRSYGWAYGVPVLACLIALVGVTWATLDRNAARPYLSPETVTAERMARRAIARDGLRVAMAAMLLTLASSWRLVASSGSISQLTIMGQNGGEHYEASWRYAELAVAAGWAAPFLEIAAFVLLLLVAHSGLRSRPVVPEGSINTTSPAGAEVVS
ncbi:hypothetical protein FHX48_001631 [Microbacterium halimionae]|uniref:Uncharacterized protein n=1 Tax=Microbacterium halimionae TaxID=1526413 RepID=A0A7W3JPM5_9MICO|nr:hypothetical protein [Microbacterium halimionae]MBA8816558.1 hypothetical protein [Microbacterium halimionae]NII95255.1 hypothetical protein [Microbacterium halimionae]